MSIGIESEEDGDDRTLSLSVSPLNENLEERIDDMPRIRLNEE